MSDSNSISGLTDLILRKPKDLTNNNPRQLTQPGNASLTYELKENHKFEIITTFHSRDLPPDHRDITPGLSTDTSIAYLVSTAERRSANEEAQMQILASGGGHRYSTESALRRLLRRVEWDLAKAWRLPVEKLRQGQELRMPSLLRGNEVTRTFENEARSQ